MTSNILTISEACEYLRMDWKHAKRSLLRMCREGKIKCRRVGRNHTVFMREWLDSYLREAANG